MLYSQPLATRFGTDLLGHIETGSWSRIDIAVAWIRKSGVRHLSGALVDFLKAGNCLSVVVGIDLDNTSKEGLQSLLQLSTHGTTELCVHHNESGAIFHPKLYLFRSASKAKLIVASNNITESGLYRNTEAGLEIDGEPTSPVIIAASNAIQAWKDTKSGLAHQLDSMFLEELVANGYVKDEAFLRAQAVSKKASSGGSGHSKKKLFASISVSAPASTGQNPKATPVAKGKEVAATKAVTALASKGVVTGQVLLMRVRKAHAVDRTTQTQIPKEVAISPFFGSIADVQSVHTGQSHSVRSAMARGIVNTLKLEIPEMRAMTDPVVRFERTASGIQYEVYDSGSAQGQAIMQALKDGRTQTPPLTKLSKPSTPDSSTWWRFI